MSDNHHEEAHTGPIKNPKQLLIAVLFSFVIPIFAIIGLVLYVTSANKPAAGAVNPEMGVAQRIQKVGAVDIRDANRPLKAGAEVYKAQCAACHDVGAAGAPKFGDTVAWSSRLKSGLDVLVVSALKGKGAMSAQSGGEFNDIEIARAVVHLTNAGGAKFAEPSAPSAEPSQASTSSVAPIEIPPASPVAASVATVNGEALYQQACQVCHAAGVAGAPKFGDKAAWSTRMSSGIDALHASVVKGKGAMPPRGGAAQASDADLRAAVEYMAAAVK
jgi:cytochrome c5